MLLRPRTLRRRSSRAVSGDLPASRGGSLRYRRGTTYPRSRGPRERPPSRCGTSRPRPRGLGSPRHHAERRSRGHHREDRRLVRRAVWRQRSPPGGGLGRGASSGVAPGPVPGPCWIKPTTRSAIRITVTWMTVPRPMATVCAVSPCPSLARRTARGACRPAQGSARRCHPDGGAAGIAIGCGPADAGLPAGVPRPRQSPRVALRLASWPRRAPPPISAGGGSCRRSHRQPGRTGRGSCPRCGNRCPRPARSRRRSSPGRYNRTR